MLMIKQKTINLFFHSKFIVLIFLFLQASSKFLKIALNREEEEKKYFQFKMTLQLDDLLRDDAKGANLIPDLSKATCDTPEEFRILMESCLEMKIKPEKVKIIN